MSVRHLSLPEGWKFRRLSVKPFKALSITAPGGFTAVVYSHDMNPNNVFYLLAEALLNQRKEKSNDDDSN